MPIVPTMASIYLDWAATAPADADLIDEYARVAATSFANPSSAHADGAAAARVLAEARMRFAAAVGARPEQVTFTSGGTESNNMSLLAQLLRKRRGNVIVSGIEHPSVYEPAHLLGELGFGVKVVPAERDGRVSVDRLGSLIDEQTQLVSVMYVNNESGAIQPVREIAAAVAECSKRFGRPIHLHSDCVQALGKIPLDCERLGVDSASFSGHKLGAPRGAGALYLKRPIATLYRGGGQEKGLRPGTENLAAIWVTALAAERRTRDLEERGTRAARLKQRLVGAIDSIEGRRFLPDELLANPERYSPFILNVAFPPLPGEVLVRAMDDEGYEISTGSACSTRSHKRLRALEAMQVPSDVAYCAVRVSLGSTTTGAEIDGFSEALARQVRALRIPAHA